MVPNGGRVYYSRRSQPPLLTQMVAAYYNATGNDSFVKEMLPVLEQEYQFWQENRSVFLDSLGYEANYYATITNQPRLIRNAFMFFCMGNTLIRGLSHTYLNNIINNFCGC